MVIEDLSCVIPKYLYLRRFRRFWCLYLCCYILNSVNAKWTHTWLSQCLKLAVLKGEHKIAEWYARSERGLEPQLVRLQTRVPIGFRICRQRIIINFHWSFIWNYTEILNAYLERNNEDVQYFVSWNHGCRTKAFPPLLRHPRAQPLEFRSQISQRLLRSKWVPSGTFNLIQFHFYSV